MEALPPGDSERKIFVPPYQGESYLPADSSSAPFTEEEREEAMQNWIAFYNDHLGPKRVISLGQRINKHWDLKRSIRDAQNSGNSLVLAGRRLQSFANYDTTFGWSLGRRIFYGAAILGLGLVTWNKAQEAKPEWEGFLGSGIERTKAEAYWNPELIDKSKFIPGINIDGLKQFPPDFSRVGVEPPNTENAFKPMIEDHNRAINEAGQRFDKSKDRLGDKATPAIVATLATILLFIKRNPLGKGIEERSRLLLPLIGKFISGIGHIFG